MPTRFSIDFSCTPPCANARCASAFHSTVTSGAGGLFTSVALNSPKLNEAFRIGSVDTQRVVTMLPVTDESLSAPTLTSVYALGELKVRSKVALRAFLHRLGYHAVDVRMKKKSVNRSVTSP